MKATIKINSQLRDRTHIIVKGYMVKSFSHLGDTIEVNYIFFPLIIAMFLSTCLINDMA